jgi:hypothetical protein
VVIKVAIYRSKYHSPKLVASPISLAPYPFLFLGSRCESARPPQDSHRVGREPLPDRDVFHDTRLLGPGRRGQAVGLKRPGEDQGHERDAPGTNNRQFINRHNLSFLPRVYNISTNVRISGETNP